MKIISKEKSKLLPRIDVEAMINHFDKKTPSVNEVKEELSKNLKVDKDLILVEHIYSNFGIGSSKIIAYVYESKEDIDKITKKGKKQKESDKKEVPEEKPAEEASPKEEEENGKETKEEQSNE